MVAINVANPSATKRFIQSLVQSEHFDELDFLKQTSSLSTPELLRTLAMIIDELQQELGVIVNNEFGDFVKLFNDIGNVGEEEFERFRDKVEIIAETVQEGAGNARRNIAKDLDRFELILPPSPAQPDALDLEVATGLFLKIKNFTNAASGSLQIPTLLLDKFATLTDRYFSLLDDTLLICLRNGNSNEWNGLVQIFSRIGKSQSLIETYRNEVWNGEIGKIISRSHYDELTKKTTATNATELIFKELFDCIRINYEIWFKHLPTSPMTSFLINCIAGPTFLKLIKELSIIFSPALPDIFHSNFTMSCYFVKQLVTLLSANELVALNEDESFQLYTKSWQLNVYYQLRFRDYAQTLEDSLAAISFEAIPPVLTDIKVMNTLEVLKSICKELCSDKVVLKPLIPRLHRLRIQSIGRVSKWLIETGSNDAPIWTAWNCLLNHVQVVKLSPELVNLDSIEHALGTEDIKKFEALNHRFLMELKEVNGRLLSSFEASLKFSLIKRAEVWSIASETVCKDLQVLKDLDEVLLLSPDFYLSAWTDGVNRFAKRAISLFEQARKAASNYQRLKSIMKDQVIGEQIDQELQLGNLSQAIHHEIESFNEFGTRIEASKDNVNAILDSLHSEIKVRHPTST